MMVCWTCRSSQDNCRISITDPKPCFTGTYRYGFGSTSVHTESVKCDYFGIDVALVKPASYERIIYQSVHQFKPYIRFIEINKILQKVGEIGLLTLHPIQKRSCEVESP